MTGRLEKLCDTIERRYDCKAEHVNSVRVTEMIGFKKTWQGVVEVFEITDHPEAKRCYTWRSFAGSEPEYVTILEIPPVSSAQTAVRAAIATGQQT
jgi:hypothetical protein